MTAVASAEVVPIVARILNCAAMRPAFLYPLHHLVSMILTYRRKDDEAQLRTKDWQGRGCQRKATLLVGHAELIRGWMTSKMRCRAVEAMAEACCAMRMMEAQKGARERLGSEGQLP